MVWRITASRKKAVVRTLCEGSLVFHRDCLDAIVPFRCFITCPPIFLGPAAKYQIQGPTHRFPFVGLPIGHAVRQLCGYAEIQICGYAGMQPGDMVKGHVALRFAAIRHLV